MRHDPRKLQIGDQVPGTKWVACRKLGEGGMGVVWEVVKPPGIRGAMKMMLPHLSARSECVDRFLGEVRLLATLEHTNIVRVYDCDLLDDGSPYLVMELLQGGTLRASMRHYGRSIPPDAAYDIIRGIGEGLDRAHAAGVVHRDVKPENTFLHCGENDRPRIVLLDFGIATLMEGTRKRGEVVGTPLYMAPEQLRGERETARTDIYAMGLLLYEMLTGRLPWDLSGSGARDVAHAHLHEPPAPASRFAEWVPPAIDDLIASALAKDPGKRPLDVFAFTSKLFELQWCRGGDQHPAGVNTTDPMLSTLADVSHAARHGEIESHDTFQGMTAPPLEGGSLEVVGGDTQIESGPEFSAETRARAAQTPPATTKTSSSGASIDRQAPTADPAPTLHPQPTHGTEIIAPSAVEPHAPEAHSGAVGDVDEPPASAPVDPCDPNVASLAGASVTRSVRLRSRARGSRRVAALGALVALVGGSLVLTRWTHRPSPAPVVQAATAKDVPTLVAAAPSRGPAPRAVDDAAQPRDTSSACSSGSAPQALVSATPETSSSPVATPEPLAARSEPTPPAARSNARPRASSPADRSRSPRSSPSRALSAEQKELLQLMGDTP